MSGDILAKAVAKNQPIKLAAFEGQFETETGAPLRIGGIPDEEKGETHYAIEIPYALSILAFGDPNATVKGLNDFPKDEHPPVAIVHFAFQIMVGCGMLMAGNRRLGGAGAAGEIAAKARANGWIQNGFCARSIFAAPLGFIAIETGWVVTEVGRQPWIIYGVMRTAEAVTPMPGLVVPFVTFTILYIFLAVYYRLAVVEAGRGQPEGRDRRTQPEIRHAA